MLKKSIHICSMPLWITLTVLLLTMSHGSFVGAEEDYGHGDLDEVMVKVDGEPVTKGEILRRIRIANGDIDPSSMEPDKWQEIVQTATKSEIIDKLFLKAARSDNMEIGPDKLETFIKQSRERLGRERFQEILGIQDATEQEFKDMVKEKMLIEAFRSKLVKNITIDNREVQEYYEKNNNGLSRPDRVHIELLVIDKGVDADALFKRLKEGEDFEKVARHDDNSKPSSIERRFSWTTYNVMPEPVRPQLKEGKTGDIIKPFLHNDKHYILKILEKRQAGTAGLDEVEDRIREVLKRKKETMTILSWYDSRVSDHKIEYLKK